MSRNQAVEAVMLLRGKRIAVVEDDVTNMAIISTLLKQHGAVVIQDPWNNDTVNRFQQSLPIELILLDLMLRNGASGFDIYDWIRANPEMAGIPIVMVTASDPAMAMNKARVKGFAGYISKPLSYREFPQQVFRLLQGESIWEDCSPLIDSRG
jgi:two-component system, cell cycle response regulator DivK